MEEYLSHKPVVNVVLYLIGQCWVAVLVIPLPKEGLKIVIIFFDHSGFICWDWTYCLSCKVGVLLAEFKRIAVVKSVNTSTVIIAMLKFLSY